MNLLIKVFEEENLLGGQIVYGSKYLQEIIDTFDFYPNITQDDVKGALVILVGKNYRKRKAQLVKVTQVSTTERYTKIDFSLEKELPVTCGAVGRVAFNIAYHNKWITNDRPHGPVLSILNDEEFKRLKTTAKQSKE